MRVGAIDCGTNSIRLLVLESDGGEVAELARRTTMVRLGQGVDATGEFHADALARTFAACEDYAAIISELGGVERLRFVATSAARDAHNRELFFAGVEQRLGVRPEIASGDEEARLSYTGAAAGIPDAVDPVLVIDIGGGSTELIRGSGGRIEAGQSLDMGAVRLRERFLRDDPPTSAQIDEAGAYVNSLLDDCHVDLRGIRTWVGVAGTVTTMAGVHLGLPRYDRRLVHHSVLDRDTIDEVAERWLTSTVEQVRAEPSMHPQRAEIICAGGLILREISHRVGVSLVVSESDILDGIAASLLA
ncbi:Ppx/GppA phosphatase family protein [Aestuariimicrobium kwangyangense]|uniref:Ppx/GppA phosphatase family protein n=1 Tax=Aestuariimicrobium kwangyangense TaxID=396389 RepID=UPI0003B3C131|nr:Ppx/GppA phosphatase family protein [Aestuariimicrobium kwangyangense]